MLSVSKRMNVLWKRRTLSPKATAWNWMDIRENFEIVEEQVGCQK